MIKLTVFQLDSVIRYSDQSLFALLETSLSEILDEKVDLGPHLHLYGAASVCAAWLENKGAAPLSDEQNQKLRKKFHKKIKALYIEDEEAFEVRPGAQSIFSHLEKAKAWKYGIISPFWQENTQFILHSCGVFSKTKLTISQDLAREESDQIVLLFERGQKKELAPEIEMVCLRKASRFKELGYRTLKPKASDKERNYYVYPRFSEFFGLKARKKKDKRLKDLN